MGLSDARHAVKHSAFAEHCSFFGHHADVVMVLDSVHPFKRPPFFLASTSPRRCAQRHISVLEARPPTVCLLTKVLAKGISLWISKRSIYRRCISAKLQSR